MARFVVEGGTPLRGEITPAGNKNEALPLIAASLGITERSAYGIVTDLAEAGYVVKQKDGRRNRYEIQTHLPLPEPTNRESTVGEVLALLAGTDLIGG